MVVVSGGLVFCILAPWDLFLCQKYAILFYSLLSQEAKELYGVQFGQLGRKLWPMEILVPSERPVILKDAGNENGVERMKLNLGFKPFS